MEEPELPVIRTPENVAKRRRIKQKKRAEGLEGPQVIVPYSSSQSAQAGDSFSVVCFFLLQPACSSDSVKTLGPENFQEQQDVWLDRKRRVRDRQSFDVSLRKGRQEVWEFVSLRIVSCFRFEEPLSLRKQDTFPAGQAQNVFNVPLACKAVIAGQAGMLMCDTSCRGIRENADAI